MKIVKNILILCGILTLTWSSLSRVHAFAPTGNFEDQDKDGMPDWWEKNFSNGTETLDPARDDAREDPDGDDLTNIEEFLYGTHPFRGDTDQDHLNDGEEVREYGTNPAMADTDAGGRSDGYEVANGHDPLNPRDDDSMVSTASLHLKPNWNLVSFPISPSVTSISDVLASISGNYVSVWGYRNGDWEMYDPNNPGMSDLATMEPGRGYWINMKDSATLTIFGSAPPDAVSLQSGWNLVGYNSRISQSVTDALSSIKGKYLSIWAFVDGTWKAYDPVHPEFSDLGTMEPGYGYWINLRDATVSCAWILP
jgi:hypothetical protein